MDQFEVVAEPRNETGKGAMRRLRRTGKVPAVVYGAGKDTVSLTVNQHTIHKQLEHEAFYSHILTVAVGKKKEQVVLKDLQRHPATSQVLHMDLLRVVATQEIDMRVPLHFINEEKCPGKKEGGVINHLITELEVRCLPKDLPEYIEVDVINLEIGDSLHLSQLTVPDGVDVVALSQETEQDQPVVSVQPPQKVVEEELEVGEEEEGLEAVEGAEPDEQEEAS